MSNFKMLVDCFGRRISTSNVIVFYIIVIANIYNFIIVWLLYDSVTRVLMGEAFKQALLTSISAETTVLIWSIIFSTVHSETVACFFIKCGAYIITFVILFLNILYTIKIADYILYKQTLEKYWKTETNQPGTEALENLYCGIVIILGANLVLRLYAAWRIIMLGNIHLTGSVDESTNNGDTEMGSVLFSTLPSYDQCQQLTPPPPYRMFKNED